MKSFSIVFPVIFLSFGLCHGLNFKVAEKKLLDGSGEMVLWASLSQSQKQDVANHLFNKEHEGAIIDDESRQALSLEAFLPALASPQTVFGQKMLKDLICYPINDDRTFDRQQLIKILSENNSLLTDLESQFAIIKEYEDDYLSFFSRDDEVFEQVLKQLYFGKRFKALNDKPVAMELRQFIKYTYHSMAFLPPLIFNEMMSDGAVAGMIFILQNLFDKNDISGLDPHNISMALDQYKQLLNQKGHRGVSGSLQKLISQIPLQVFKNVFRWARQGHDLRTTDTASPDDFEMNLGDEVRFYKDSDVNAQWKNLRIGRWACRAALDVLWAYRLHQSYKAIRFQDDIAQALHKKVYGVSRIFVSMQTIDKKLDYVNGGVFFDSLKNICCRPNEVSLQMANLASVLTSWRLTSPGSAASLRGSALAGYTLIDKTKNEWANALTNLGELEVCVEIAKKVRDGHMCFAQEINGAGPYLRAKGLRNPVVSSSVEDSIEIGAGCPVKNILIAGPHGSGKSTAQRTIGYNVLSSMVFGTAFAQEFAYSRPDKILVYANVRDEIEQGLSSFMAECERISAIEKFLSELKPDQVCFTLTDEVFKGTMEEEGAKRYYEFCKKVIEQAPNTIFIGTTHFHKLLDLQKDTDNRIVNYYVEVDEPEEGKFVRTFNLKRGIIDWWFNDKAKRERFINWLKLDTMGSRFNVAT